MMPRPLLWATFAIQVAIFIAVMINHYKNEKILDRMQQRLEHSAGMREKKG